MGVLCQEEVHGLVPAGRKVPPRLRLLILLSLLGFLDLSYPRLTAWPTRLVSPVQNG